MTKTEELELKIKTEEETYLKVVARRNTGWLPLVVSIGLLIYIASKLTLNLMYLLLAGVCLLYLGLNIWRVLQGNRQKKQLETALLADRARLAELQAQPPAELLADDLPSPAAP
jgi:hypothetical protein